MYIIRWISSSFKALTGGERLARLLHGFRGDGEAPIGACTVEEQLKPTMSD